MRRNADADDNSDEDTDSAEHPLEEDWLAALTGNVLLQSVQHLR